MKKIIFCIATIGITTSALALTTGGLQEIACFIDACGSRITADSSCDSICTWCSGSETVPTGYVFKPAFETGTYDTSFSRQVSQVCGVFTYSCVCGAYGGLLAQNGSLLCDTGYYGEPSYEYTQRLGGVFSGCYRCPSSGGVYGTTAGPGATRITECYIPAGNSFSDDAGNGVYSDNCYYLN